MLTKPMRSKPWRCVRQPVKTELNTCTPFPGKWNDVIQSDCWPKQP